jgi:hypothetical protein
MVTIQNLEVQFDVEGEGDEAVFARLFEQHMRRWQRAEQLQLERERRMRAESSVDGHSSERAS